MPGQTALVDVMTMEIQRQSGASVLVEDITSFEVTATQESRPVFTMRPDRTPRGFKHGARNVSGNMEVVVPTGGLEVDFEEMMRNKEAFDAICSRGVGGLRKSLLNALITEVVEGSNGEGEHTFRVNFVAADYRSDAPGIAGI
jgi:hypothetical protein